ncbi:MAG: hypothetical protein M3198_04645 [Actinomycetota bacterium]|nr:hypothetical protein [Actinomycetota bacterium]
MDGVLKKVVRISSWIVATAAFVTLPFYLLTYWDEERRSTFLLTSVLWMTFGLLYVWICHSAGSGWSLFSRKRKAVQSVVALGPLPFVVVPALQAALVILVCGGTLLVLFGLASSSSSGTAASRLRSFGRVSGNDLDRIWRAKYVGESHVRREGGVSYIGTDRVEKRNGVLWIGGRVLTKDRIARDSEFLYLDGRRVQE